MAAIGKDNGFGSDLNLVSLFIEEVVATTIHKFRDHQHVARGIRSNVNRRVKRGHVAV